MMTIATTGSVLLAAALQSSAPSTGAVDLFCRGNGDRFVTTQTKVRQVDGSIKTLSLNVTQAQLRPVEKENEKSPDYRIFAKGTEFGAAWKKTSRENRDYLSVKLDDPSFPAPIYANLVDAEEGYSLVWSRNTRPAN